jgi:Flp pilus assembly protein TadG
MSRRSAHARASGNGQGLVEFALALPVILLIFFGIFDMGRAVFAYNTVANAAREGARVAIVNQIPTSPDCNQNKPIENPLAPHWSVQMCAANAGTSLGIKDTDVTVTYSRPPGTTLKCPAEQGPGTPVNVGCIASVKVVYTFHALTPVIGAIVGDIGMSSTSKVPVERVFP